MIERVIKQFTFSYFIGVKEVVFFLINEKRNIQITFNSHEDLKKSWPLCGPSKELFSVDEEALTFIVDRDWYETVMFTTAAKDAMDSWIRKMVEDRDKEECEN